MRTEPDRGDVQNSIFIVGLIKYKCDLHKENDLDLWGGGEGGGYVKSFLSGVKHHL